MASCGIIRDEMRKDLKEVCGGCEVCMRLCRKMNKYMTCYRAEREEVGLQVEERDKSERKSE